VGEIDVLVLQSERDARRSQWQLLETENIAIERGIHPTLRLDQLAANGFEFLILEDSTATLLDEYLPTRLDKLSSCQRSQC
jgi:hypothetical protein